MTDAKVQCSFAEHRDYMGGQSTLKPKLLANCTGAAGYEQFIVDRTKRLIM